MEKICAPCGISTITKTALESIFQCTAQQICTQQSEMLVTPCHRELNKANTVLFVEYTNNYDRT